MLYSQSEIIKHHRQLKGLTQAQLAEGICSRMHIVNVENGTRKLSDFIFKDVLLKLDLDPNDFNVGIDAQDEDTLFLMQMEKEVATHLAHFNRLGLEKVKNAINNRFKDSNFGEYLALRIDMHLNLPQSDSINNPDLPKPDILKAREYAIKALKLKRADFDLAKIDTYFLTIREYSIISALATTYGYLDDLPKEVEILDKLKANYEKNHKIVMGGSGLNTFYATLLTNISINYKLLGMWEQCLQHATQNMEIFLKHNNVILYTRAIYQRAYSLMKLGRTDEGKEYYNKFFMLAYVLDGYAAINFAVVKKEYEDVFGGIMDIRAEW
ncbi:MAG: helix-turn-helix domain-containing protein [Defluviitaleaceae bacterium]|nr:helix-turn-helix domain-containing protein [Defluviitaleaceae bacterium]